MGINLGQTPIKAVYLGQTAVKSAFFGSQQVWSGEEPVPEWLCFTAEQASSTLHLDKNGSPDAISLETSTDGETWTDYSWTDNTGDTLTLANVGDKVYMRAKTENQTIGSSSSNYYKFVMSGKIAASGNIQTLLKADGSRTDAPTRCYQNMFQGCSSLTTAPALPATTLGHSCYRSMFQSCSSLTTAPALPATTLAENCYYGMFTYCTSLTAAPALPAMTLVNGCYSTMFQSCISLTSAPALPATTLATNCYSGMFNACTSLTTAPKLPATTLIGSCYSSMFYNCQSLSSVEVAFTAWDPSNATTNWLANVAASGTFTCPLALPETTGSSNIPEGWTKVDSGYPTSNLLMHFDGIDNTGAGDASHSTDTQTWANVDGSLTGYYLKRPSTTYNTSWDSKGAVLTGAYDQAFWLTDPQGNTVSALSSVDTGSFTYALAFYYDPSTLQNYRGYIGQEGGTNDSFAYLVCDSGGVRMRLRYAGNQIESQRLDSYLTQGEFNTLAFVYDSTAQQLKCFVNGVLRDTVVAQFSAPFAQSKPLTLGGGVQSSGSNRVCKGKIHDFFVYSRALADAEVARIHSYQSARFNS